MYIHIYIHTHTFPVSHTCTQHVHTLTPTDTHIRTHTHTHPPTGCRGTNKKNRFVADAESVFALRTFAHFCCVEITCGCTGA